MPADQIRALLPAIMGGHVWRSLAGLLELEGIDAALLIGQRRVPPDLFRTVTARTPDSDPSMSAALPADVHKAGARVVSLLE